MNISSDKTRTERDTMGEIQVPAEALWGAQTQRSRQNFSIGIDRFSPAMIRALGVIKRASAEVNMGLGKLEQRVGRAIVQAADEVIGYELDARFPLVVWQQAVACRAI